MWFPSNVPSESSRHVRDVSIEKRCYRAPEYCENTQEMKNNKTICRQWQNYKPYSWNRRNVTVTTACDVLIQRNQSQILQTGTHLIDEDGIDIDIGATMF